jgi:hypothetical protein
MCRYVNMTELALAEPILRASLPFGHGINMIIGRERSSVLQVAAELDLLPHHKPLAHGRHSSR